VQSLNEMVSHRIRWHPNYPLMPIGNRFPRRVIVRMNAKCVEWLAMELKRVLVNSLSLYRPKIRTRQRTDLYPFKIDFGSPSKVVRPKSPRSSSDYCDDCEEYGHSLDLCPMANEMF
jgi:hypothetical protein